MLSPKPRAVGTVRKPDGQIGIVPLAIWFGLAAGVVEVLTRLACAAVGRNGHLYLMSRHFVWLVPLIDLLIFFVMGLILAPVVRISPGFGRRTSLRGLLTLALLPSILLAVPEVYPLAWLVLVLGICVRWVAPFLERHPAGFQRFVLVAAPVLVMFELAFAGWIFGGDRLKQSRESSRPRPSASAPNVLLIVLDTVRADHTSAYGYLRDTTPSLERLAVNGVRFDAAQASAPWTLASHASMFTGRFPHQLGTDWMTPMNRRYPTLAEYLGSKGYATAGFVGNTFYCAYDTGLARGFTHYEDYELRDMDALLLAQLPKSLLEGFFSLSTWVGSRWGHGVLGPAERFVGTYVHTGKRKDAATVNRGFFGWLNARPEPDRPFFAFLNYTDAHDPYLPPKPTEFRYGLKPTTPQDFDLLQDWVTVDKRKLRAKQLELAEDCYDDCIRSMDDQLALLLSNLAGRNLMERTIVIVASDHGEGFGEHRLFSHGNSLYRPELHVPLIVRVPDSMPARHVVSEPVSLRDLPATIADLLQFRSGSPFPGRSLVGTWDGAATDARPAPEPVVSELSSPNPWDIGQQAPSPARDGLLTSITLGPYKWISNKAHAELFDLSRDPDELTNLVDNPEMRPVVDKFRAELDRVRSR